MKNKFLFGILIATLLMGFVYAENPSFKQAECQSILGYSSNIIGKEIPEEVPFKKEIFNVYIEDENYGFLEISESKTKDFDCFENEKATYDVFIEGEKTLFDIYESKDFSSTIIEKINNKEIEIKGHGLIKKIKVFFVKMGIKWLG